MIQSCGPSVVRLPGVFTLSCANHDVEVGLAKEANFSGEGMDKLKPLKPSIHEAQHPTQNLTLQVPNHMGFDKSGVQIKQLVGRKVSV